ncbi:MAG: TonB-dependent receptor [Lutibacter sp.]|nr:TonB-dependent receptor [Lutibacter sp.]MDP3945349.1 TonB-dependent receptor [Lutibacter sp.]
MHHKLIITSFFILVTSVSFSQITKKKDTLKTEEITVEKPYAPTISDAFKVRSNPNIENETKNLAKEKVSYSIFSVPVASTFSPSKGKAQSIARGPKERFYENYLSAGYGNFNTPFLDAFVHFGDKKNNDFGIFLNHLSSEGGIKDLLLNDNFSDSKIDVYYKQFDRYYNFQINAGSQLKKQNYYGLSDEITYGDAFIAAMDEEQIYKTVYGGGKVSFEDSFFRGASAEIVNFSDDYNSNEIRLLVKPTLEFPISKEKINGEFLVDLISGRFKQSYTDGNDVNYSFLNLGFSPNLEIVRESFTLNLGAKLYYVNDLEHKSNDYFAYPNVTTSFKMIDEVLTVFAGVTGDLEQNSYKSFAEENPFVSPTLDIQQTDKQYRAYVGTKGKLASNIGYNFNVSHTSEKNKPFFIQNQTKTDGTIILVEKGYEAGNSFGVVYDNVKTLGFFGEITIDASKEFNFTGTLNYSHNTVETLLEAWNTPKMMGTISADYQNKDWFAGAKLFYNGETEDFVIPYGFTAQNGVIVTNESYMDLNLNGGYNFSDRLTVFAKINNALGEKYHRFLNYQVQTLQILGGLTYKFDL